MKENTTIIYSYVLVLYLCMNKLVLYLTLSVFDFPKFIMTLILHSVQRSINEYNFI